MAGKTKPEEVKPEEVKTAGDGEVTVSKAEFEQMKEQLALLQRLMTSDSRYKTAEVKKREEEEETIEFIKSVNDKSMEPVTVHLDRGNLKGNKNAEVSINGVQYIVPKGKDVTIPRCVAEVLLNAEKQKEAAYDLQGERSADFEAALAEGAF